VAHRLSAIALLAQGGRVVSETRPEEAVQVLHLIEESASEALGELRTLVGALRSDGVPSLGPQPTLSDLEGLASPAHEPLVVTVDVRDHAESLASVPTALQSALYRIAQESITNARRHAKHATRVQVSLNLTASRATLSVVDDGRSRGAREAGDLGFGLVGMAERAELLGGTLKAGPLPDRGWRVTASFPVKKGTS
jgi:signal transduction histidine kinase